MALAYVWCLAFVAHAVIGRTIDPSCGRAGSSLWYRIIGGRQAGNCQYPWMVKLEIFKGGGTYGCGGSIIDSTHILTAAHCLVKYDTGRIAKASEAAALTGSASLSLSRRIQASAFQLHEGYSPSEDLNDIAIITLSEPITFDECHVPICLPDSQDNALEASGCLAMGWGRTSNYYEDSASTVLLYTPVKVEYPVTRCTRFSSWDKTTQLCVYGQNQSGTCRGDSGGPLVCQNSDGRYTQYGVVSFGAQDKCGLFPSVFTKVSQYVSWIKKNTA